MTRASATFPVCVSDASAEAATGLGQTLAEARMDEVRRAVVLHQIQKLSLVDHFTGDLTEQKEAHTFYGLATFLLRLHPSQERTFE